MLANGLYIFLNGLLEKLHVTSKKYCIKDVIFYSQVQLNSTKILGLLGFSVFLSRKCGITIYDAYLLSTYKVQARVQVCRKDLWI